MPVALSFRCNLRSYNVVDSIRAVTVTLLSLSFIPRSKNVARPAIKHVYGLYRAS